MRRRNPIDRSLAAAVMVQGSIMPPDAVAPGDKPATSIIRSDAQSSHTGTLNVICPSNERPIFLRMRLFHNLGVITSRTLQRFYTRFAILKHNKFVRFVIIGKFLLYNNQNQINISDSYHYICEFLSDYPIIFRCLCQLFSAVCIDEQTAPKTLPTNPVRAAARAHGLPCRVRCPRPW